MDCDVVVIGAGVVGAMITRKRVGISCDLAALRESDRAMGVSKANSAIIHAEYESSRYDCFHYRVASRH